MKGAFAGLERIPNPMWWAPLMYVAGLVWWPLAALVWIVVMALTVRSMTLHLQQFEGDMKSYSGALSHVLTMLGVSVYFALLLLLVFLR